MEPELTGSHVFGAATERMYTIETFDFPAAQRVYDAARGGLVGDQGCLARHVRGGSQSPARPVCASLGQLAESTDSLF
ncbi:MAG: hypothetical protein H6729_12190 [Deltaproteobacteria bacterium]|nr:hypothetical protein [Deltaproteobacteria bacterium]